MYLRIKEPWVDILVDVPVLGPQLCAVVGPSLAGEFAVEDQDVALLFPGTVMAVTNKKEMK